MFGGIGMHADVGRSFIHPISISNVALIASRERSVFLMIFLCLSNQKGEFVI
jgi:hypothetical protein